MAHAVEKPPSVRCQTASCASQEVAAQLQRSRVDLSRLDSDACPTVNHPLPQNPAVCADQCRVHPSQQVRLALCFFGLPRSLSLTLPSLSSNLLRSLRDSVGEELDVFVHSMLPSTPPDDIPHSPPIASLKPCAMQVADQAALDATHGLRAKAAATFTRGLLTAKCGKYSTLFPGYTLTEVLNIYRSRLSLSLAARLVLSHERRRGFVYSHVAAVRPDVAFLTPFAWTPARTTNGAWQRGVWTPNILTGDLAVSSAVQANRNRTDELGSCTRSLYPANRMGGVNDRFAIGDRRSMLEQYMAQFDAQLAPFDSVELSTSEILLCTHLAAVQVPIGVVPLCMLRVRPNGSIAQAEMELFVARERPQYCRGLRLLSRTGDLENECNRVRAVAAMVHER